MLDKLRPVVEASKRRDAVLARVDECRPRLSAALDAVIETGNEWNALIEELQRVNEEVDRAIEEAKG